MNALERWIEENGFGEIPIMNHLQQYGIVSDNCIGAADVANAEAAVEWLEGGAR